MSSRYDTRRKTRNIEENGKLLFIIKINKNDTLWVMRLLFLLTALVFYGKQTRFCLQALNLPF